MDFGAKTACKANEILAQGNALGCNNGVDCALQGQKHYDIYKAFALSGRLLAHSLLPQGVALG